MFGVGAGAAVDLGHGQSWAIAGTWGLKDLGLKRVGVAVGAATGKVWGELAFELELGLGRFGVGFRVGEGRG